MKDIKIEYLSIDKLKPYEKNTRKHDEDDIAQIKKSIQDFGFDDPIGIWSKDNIIVEGHGRFMAAKELGIKEVPVIRLDHLTDEQRRLYGIMHNKLAELSAWDFSMLQQEAQDLDLDGYDLNLQYADTSTQEEKQKKEKEKKTEKKQVICPRCGGVVK